METIVAISTAIGEGGIGIVRLSGPLAISATDKYFKHIKGKNLNQLSSHRIYYGHFYDDNNNIIDEVLISLMKAPMTYTKEDVVEINCHGGVQSVKRILEQLIQEEGVRIAEAGEFTKRAFLNGRIDLAQAESVIDVIKSQTDSALRASVSQLQGVLSRKIDQIYSMLLEVQAEIALNIDYPEYEEYESSQLKVQSSLRKINTEVIKLLENSKLGRIIREGLKTAIIGKPNVGKSSLLNALLGEDRAIVTDIPGTTRDTVEEYVNLDGIPLHVIDTAGIRESNNKVEQIGIERSKIALNTADLVLLVFDSSQGLNENDYTLLNLAPIGRTIIVLNKNDLKQKINIDELKNIKHPQVYLSALKGEGLIKLKNIVNDMFYSGNIESNNNVLISNIRHIKLLEETKKEIENALNALDLNMPIDLVNIDIDNARQSLGKITGKIVEEELLDYIFSEFCVGK